jgi:hypothetical protein
MFFSKVLNGGFIPDIFINFDFVVFLIVVLAIVVMPNEIFIGHFTTLGGFVF